MGPRSINRGIPMAVMLVEPVQVASMGPRSINRGITHAGHQSVGAFPASMGPRSINRGIARTAQASGTRATRFNGAAVDQPRNYS